MIAPVTYFRYLLLVAVLYCPGLFGQSTDKNFVLTRTYKSSTNTVSGNVKVATQEVSYLDGLGRPLQSINAHASPAITNSRPADLVSHTEYDPMGRVSKVSAAYPQEYAASPAVGNGRYVGGAPANSVAFYDNASNFDVKNNRAYALTEYEPSPLNRISKQFAVGSDRAMEFLYGFNASEVKRYDINGSGDLSENGNYEANRLTYTETKDENGNRIREYKDKSGVLVLKRVYIDNDELSTYYVYDDLSRLRFVLQPEYQGGSANRINKYAFRYNYNDRGLMTIRYVPGGGTTTMAYDNKDRLETSTDGNGKVTYFKYDGLNRVIETGERSGGNDLPLAKTFYDNYSFGGVQAFVSNYGNGYSSSYRSDVTGMVTGAATRILNPDGTYSDTNSGWLYTTTYYDDRFNVIQMIRGLYDLGGNEYVARQLRFDGRVEKELTKQQVATGDHSVEKMYEYDHADRLLCTRYIIKSSNTEMKNIVVAANRYDGLGQMRQKYLNSTNASNFREQLDYSYVPNGWMSKMLGKTSAGDNFGVELKYTNTANSQYNGNIGEMSWKRTGNANWAGYNFTYDKANRLTNAAGTHQEQISYDRNGNIQTLNRWIDGSQKDGLTYIYENGNQLTKVTDSQGAEGFNNGSSGNDNDYAYDGNGNATQDKNRNISENGIQYNILNLPRQIVVDGKTLKYHYEATGSKLRMENSNGTVNTKYAGAFEYNNGNYLTRIATEEGQISIINNGANASDYSFEYYLRDHLGNTRMVLNEAGTIVQETEYMPFGLALLRTAGNNKYLYNGKEKQPETGLLDYGARQYDPTIGRWTVIDPKAELFGSISPFNYIENNPTNGIDPDGTESMAITTRYVDPSGNTLLNTNDGRNDVFLVSGSKLENFKRNAYYAQQTGMSDSQGWNNYWRSESRMLIPGALINMLHGSEAGINSLVKYQLNGNLSDLLSFEFDEVGGQWKDPELVIGSLSAGLSARAIIQRTTKGLTKISPYSLEITHGLTMSKKELARLKANIKLNGVLEPISFVEHNGKKFVVNGHHRLRIAKELGIKEVPVQQVKLPFAGYKTVYDLMYSNY